MSNPNSLGNNETQANGNDDTGWDSLSQVTFRGGMRTGEYLNSNEGDQELSIEETFDKWSAEIDDMVNEGKMTEEEGYKMKETMLDSAVEGIDTVRQDYLNRINGRNPQESEPEPTADELAYQKWLAEHPGKSEGYESAHGNTSGPSFSEMDFSRPRDVRDKVVKDAEGNIVGVDKEGSKTRTYSEWDVYNKQKGETPREFGDRAKSRHEAEGRYQEREKLIQDVMQQYNNGEFGREYRDKRFQTIMNAAPEPQEAIPNLPEEDRTQVAVNAALEPQEEKTQAVVNVSPEPQEEKMQAVVNVSPEPQEIVADLPGEENPTEDKNESQINETAPMETRDEKPNPEVMPVETRDKKTNPEVVSVETVNDTSTKADVAKPQAKKGFFGKIRSLFSRNKQKKNETKGSSELSKEQQLVWLKEAERRIKENEAELNARMQELDRRAMRIKQKMDELYGRTIDKPFAQAVKEAGERS